MTPSHIWAKWNENSRDRIDRLILIANLDLLSINNLFLFADTFKKAVLLNYDPVNMNDKFAEIMLENLKHRDCHFLVSTTRMV